MLVFVLFAVDTTLDFFRNPDERMHFFILWKVRVDVITHAFLAWHPNARTAVSKSPSCDRLA